MRLEMFVDYKSNKHRFENGHAAVEVNSWDLFREVQKRGLKEPDELDLYRAAIAITQYTEFQFIPNENYHTTPQPA